MNKHYDTSSKHIMLHSIFNLANTANLCRSHTLNSDERYICAQENDAPRHSHKLFCMIEQTSVSIYRVSAFLGSPIMPLKKYNVVYANCATSRLQSEMKSKQLSRHGSNACNLCSFHLNPTYKRVVGVVTKGPCGQCLYAKEWECTAHFDCICRI